MLRPSQFLPNRQAVHKPKGAKGASDFLQSDDGLAALLPAVARMAALQKDCAALLPAMFDACDVLQYDADRLVLSTPNAGLAAKLKQQLPKLQAHLVKSGWQVNAIRVKVQVSQAHARAPFTKQIQLPPQALEALNQLGQTLENSAQNQTLIEALRTLVARHRASAKPERR